MAKKKYRVYSATIKDDDGVKRKHGDVVELSGKTAKHYNDLGYLRPYTEDEVSEDFDDDNDEPPPSTVVEGTVLAGSVAPEVSNEDELQQKVESHGGNPRHARTNLGVAEGGSRPKEEVETEPVAPTDFAVKNTKDVPESKEAKEAEKKKK